MRIPKEIIISGHTVKIEHVRDLKLNGEDCWGIYDDDKHVIYLKTGMDKTRKMEVLLHECLHAIEHIEGLKSNEKTIDILGRGLLALIRNNKLNFLERKTTLK